MMLKTEINPWFQGEFTEYKNSAVFSNSRWRCGAKNNLAIKRPDV